MEIILISVKIGLSSHDYIMKIVPTIYEAGSKRTISYQYTYAYRSFLGRGSSPAIWVSRRFPWGFIFISMDTKFNFHGNKK